MPADIFLHPTHVEVVDGRLVANAGVVAAAPLQDGNFGKAILTPDGIELFRGIKIPTRVTTDRIESPHVHTRLLTAGTDGRERIRLHGQYGNLELGGGGADGDLLVKNAAGRLTVGINGQRGNVTCGGNGSDGDAIFLDATGKPTIHLDSGLTGRIDPHVSVYLDGSEADLVMGREGNAGSVTCVDTNGQATVKIGSFQDGNPLPLLLEQTDNEPRELSQVQGADEHVLFRVTSWGTARLGGKRFHGHLYLRNRDENHTIELHGGDAGRLSLGNKPRRLAGTLEVHGGGSPGTTIVGGHLTTSRLSAEELIIGGSAVDITQQLTQLSSKNDELQRTNNELTAHLKELTTRLENIERILSNRP